MGIAVDEDGSSGVNPALSGSLVSIRCLLGYASEPDERRGVAHVAS